MPATALIELRDVDIAAGSQSIVRRMSLDVAPGRVLAIVSERSEVRIALLDVLSGAIGNYTVKGDLTMDGRELVARVATHGSTQAQQHVARVTDADGRTRVRDLASAAILDTVQLSALDTRVNALAPDDRVRAAFAVALARKPRVLLVDVPYMADADTRYPVHASLLQRIARDGSLAMVVTTDSLAVAADIADDVLVTLDGCPVEYGSVYDICLRPAAPFVHDLLLVTASPHRALPEFTGFVDYARREGCPWVLNCRAGVVHECSHVPPPMRAVAPGHMAACHIVGGDA